MKNLFFLFFFTVLISFSSQASAQSFTQYTWDEHAIKFKVPNTFTVSENNYNKFSAGDDLMWVTIYPKSGSEISYNDMSNLLTTWADNNGIYGYNSILDGSNNGFWGVYLNGNLSSNGLPVFAGMFVHPDYPSMYYYVWINYKSEDQSTAQEVLNSFTPTK